LLRCCKGRCLTIFFKKGFASVPSVLRFLHTIALLLLSLFATSGRKTFLGRALRPPEKWTASAYIIIALGLIYIQLPSPIPVFMCLRIFSCATVVSFVLPQRRKPEKKKLKRWWILQWRDAILVKSNHSPLASPPPCTSPTAHTSTTMEHRQGSAQVRCRSGGPCADVESRANVLL
jgi:hypothetical protein